MMISQEYGKRLTLATGYDLSANTALRIEMQRPDGTVTVFTTGVTLGTTNETVVDSRGVTHRLVANEYLFRDWVDGDIDVPGRYRVRAVYVDASKELRSPQVVFPVAP